VTNLLVMYVLSGGLLAALSLPLLRGKVRPNSWYGFRVPSTLGDPAVWYPVNRAMARWLLVAGVVTMAGAIALYFVPHLTLDQYAWLCLLVFAVPVTLGIFSSVRVLRRLTQSGA